MDPMATGWNDFEEEIRPFLKLWEYGAVTCFARRHDNRYACVGLRVLLSEAANQPRGSWLLPCDGDFLLAYIVLPLHETLNLIRMATIDSRVQLPNREVGLVDVFLLDVLSTPQLARPIWRSRQINAEHALREHPMRRLTIELASGTSDLYGLFPSSDATRLDEWLKARPDDSTALPINGLKGWIEEYSPNFDVRSEPGRRVYIQFLAPIPIESSYSRSDDAIVAACPPLARELVEACVFFQPAGSAQRARLSALAAEPDGHALERVSVRLNWPKNAERAEIAILAAGRQIDRLTLPRWRYAGSLPAAINTYFDCDHSILRKQLGLKGGSPQMAGQSPSPQKQTAKDLSKQDQFEHAIIRLLTLLGLPSVLYGTKGSAAQSKPDGVSILVDMNPATILLIECTTERPGDKVMDLGKRVAELESHLKKNDFNRELRVVGVVFSGAEPSVGEITSGLETGVHIKGPDEIECLLSMLNGPRPNARDVLSLVITSPIPYLAERFSSRFTS